MNNQEQSTGAAALPRAIEDFMSACRAKYQRVDRGDFQGNASLLQEVTALNAAYFAARSTQVAPCDEVAPGG